MGEVLLAGEKAHERPALLGNGVAQSPLQHRIAGLEGVDQRSLSRLTGDLELYLPIHVCEVSQVRRQPDADHGNVWTSTDRTAGKSLTMGAQLLPASAEE